MTISKAQIENMRKKVTKGEGLNNFYLVFGDENVKGFMNRACLAQFSIYSKRELKDAPITHFIDYCFYKLKYRHENREDFTDQEKTYLDWLLNRSPWRHIFITKDVEELWHFGCVYDTSLPVKLVFQGAALMRSVSEYADFVSRWSLFAPHIHPCLAIMLAYDVEESSWGFTLRRNATVNSNHQAWRSSYMGNKIKSVISEDVVDHPPMALCSEFSPSENIWKGVSKNIHYPKTKEKIMRIWGKDIALDIVDNSQIKKFVSSFLDINGLKGIGEKL